MKKFFLLATIASLAFASCDDVPAPYGLFDPTDPNNQGGGGIVATIVPEGDGSAESPFNVAAAIAKCKELGTTLSSEVYYVKGIAKSVNESGISQYGNINVDMVDASGSSDVFVAWQIVSFGGAKFTEEGVVSVGDTIVIKGKIYNYMGNTPESEGKGATQLVSVNGKSGNGGGTTPDPTPVEAKGTGTASDPFNVAAAIAKCQELGTTLSTDAYYVQGLVKSVNESGIASYGNINVDMVDVAGSSAVFTAFQIVSFDGAKFTESGIVKAGDTIVVLGKIYNYMGNTPETEGKGASQLVSVNGKTEGSGTIVTPPANEDANTAATAFTVAQANARIEAATELEKYVYVKGFISQIDEVSTSYGNATYYISDDKTTTNQLEVYRGYSLGGAKFAAEDEIKVGDEVIVYGKLVDFKGTKEFSTGSKIYSLNGKVAESTGGNTGGGNGGNTGTVDVPAGEGILAAVMASNSELPSNSYGTQAVAEESTWVNWKMGGISYKGVKVCQAPSTQVPNTLQMQGNASDAAKQGFLFNSDAFASDIKKITVVLKVKEATSGTTYDPGYSLYIGASAHPVSDAVEPNSGYTTADGVRTYVQEFDLSGKSVKYFTIANDKQGALYIDKVVVELK